MSLESTKKAMEVLIRTAQEHPFPGLLTLRYVWQSQALLAFTKFPITCTIELPAANSRRTHHFYDAAYTALKKEGIPFTLHWGQTNDLQTDGAGKVRERWGTHTVTRWLLARRKILSTPAELKRFSNDLSDWCQLSS